MNLIVININSISIGHPLPFSLRDESGVLLASKGYVVKTRDDLLVILGHRSKLYVDLAESQDQLKAYQDKLLRMVRQNQKLGVIAAVRFATSYPEGTKAKTSIEKLDWVNLQGQANAMLLDTNPESFSLRLDNLQTQIIRHVHDNPDASLFALIYMLTHDAHMYSATHAMLVAAMCCLTARQVLNWPPESEVTLCKAALTMELGMTKLVDLLARQKTRPNSEQREERDQLAGNSVHLLSQLGINDPIHLEAVALHRDQTAGPLASRSEGGRMARLIQRANRFTDQLATRSTKSPNAASSLMHACYLDENGQPDVAGAALIKAVGIYPPGTFVRLVTDEIGMVVKRGPSTSTPNVAVLINRDGMPNGVLIVRSTSKQEFRIVAAVPHQEIKVKVTLERLMRLI